MSKRARPYAVGNQTTGVQLDRRSFADLYNGFIQFNGSGLSVTAESTATGNTNIISNNESAKRRSPHILFF
jgi:hypothetical protein